MYFDAVLDDRMTPLFNGTPEETKAWLERWNPPQDIKDTLQVCRGKTLHMLTVDEYLGF